MKKTELWDWIYPRRCPICDDIVPMGQGKICPSCQNELIYIKEPICKKCGKQLLLDTQEYCIRCSETEYMFDQGRSLYLYESVKETVYRFKYQNRQEYAEFFGEEIVRYLGNQIRRWKPNGMIPVPLHPKRMKKRGYNQAALLTQVVGRKMNIPVYPKYVERIENTRPQKELNEAQRQNNLKRAFKISQNDVKLGTIIIFDDIYTTGSTVHAISAELKKKGVERVFIISLAIGKE